ncbi:MAG TPA: tetratricopeptide repeat protein, partial [Chloroflexi bacterium]|nr:tetratricopeptide repeat protein [Chloroflexota bacterium]
MKLTVLATALSTSVLLALCSASARISVPPLILLRQGQALQTAKEYSKALENYGQLADLRGDWSEPHTLMGEIYVQQGRWEEAYAEFSLAREIEPRDPRALYGLGQVAHYGGETGKAALLWTSALSLDPTDTQVRCSLARLYMETSRLDLAQQHLRRILLSEGQHQEAHYLLGLVAAADAPFSAVRHLQTAVQGEDQQLSSKARSILDLLAEDGTEESQAGPIGRLALASLEQGFPNLAVEWLQELLADEPGNQRAQAYLGYALLSSGQPVRALETLRAVTRSDPKDPLGHYFLGVVHRSQGYLPTALWDFKRSLRLDPANAATYAEMADTLRRMADYTAAEEWYRAACTVAPGEPGFWVLLAQFHVDVVPDEEKGLVAATKAVSLRPEDPVAQDLLGWALYLGGDLAGAKTALERAISLDAGFARGYYHLGVVSCELGDEDRATWAYRRAVDLDA